MKTMIRVLGLFCVMFGLMLSACSDDENARIQVLLTDAPGDYEEVNIDIQDVQINRTEGTSSGWESIDIENKGVYNLLELTNGLDTLLGTLSLPSGRISQIRLVLGTNNSVKVAGTVKELTAPSAQQSGLKINLQQTLKDGVTYRILLDFDVARSIVARGNQMYSLKPVIRAIVEATTGGIRGDISPVEANPAIYAINGTDTVGTTFPDADGKFLLRGILGGTYKVSFVPKTGYLTKTVENVVVTSGSVNNMGTVVIDPQ